MWTAGTLCEIVENNMVWHCIGVCRICLNEELPWADKQAEVYVHAYQVCLNPLQTQMEQTHNIAVLSHGIRSLDHRLEKICVKDRKYHNERDFGEVFKY